MLTKNFVTKAVLLIAFLLVISVTAEAKVSQATADSIANILNCNPNSGSCSASCPLYSQENSGISLTNSIFIALLLVFGSYWFYTLKRKKYILILGGTLAAAVVGSYFVRPLLNTSKNSENCLIVAGGGKAANDTAFTAPGNEFQAAGDEFQAADAPAKPAATTTSAAASADEFTPVSGDEFSGQGAAAAPAKVSPAPSQSASLSVEKERKAIYEPLAIFLVLGLIGWLLRYQWFRKLRGLVLLGGLVYLGFYRSACPCMISGFQDTVLVLFGAPVSWTATLWFLVLIPATYLFGKVWCGWLCHLGALQEFLYRAPKLKVLATAKAQRILKIVQISVFVLWILQLIISGSNWFCEYDPFKSAFNLIAPDWVGYVLLGILLVSSVLIYRPFCRSICPVGLVLGWTSLLPGARRLVKNDACMHCSKCSNECKQGALIHEDKQTILRTQDCILCGECLHSCHKDALKVTRKKTKKVLPLLLLFFLFSTLAQAQWECPSRIGGSLKPFGSSNWMWAGEGTTSAGFIGNEGIANMMLFGALNYSANHHTLYLEGGGKAWYRLSSDRKSNGSARIGLREGYYRFNNDVQSLTLGLQSTKSDDYFMVNERMVGLNYRVSAGKVDFNLLGGSVMKEFARNGVFCTLGYLYNIIPGRNRAILGNSFGETNFTMLSATWRPHKQTAADEFSASDDGLGESKESAVLLNTLGAFGYHEFGKWTTYNTWHTGIYGEVGFWGVNIKPELILQSGKNNRALIYSIGLDKQIDWNNGQQTRLMARYVGMKTIDSAAVAAPSFSNIFAGEVLRLDALDMPFVQAGIKHSFPDAKASIKLQGALQTGDPKGYVADQYNTKLSRLKEVDFTFSKNIGKMCLINATAGFVSYPKMEVNDQSKLQYKTKNSPWGKVEVRFTF